MVEHAQLQVQREQVEALGLLVLGIEFSGQAGHVVRQRGQGFSRDVHPGFGFRVLLDEPAVRPHHEVVEVHCGYFLLQQFCNRAAHFLVRAWVAVYLASLPRLVVTGWSRDTVQGADQLQAVVEQPRGQ